MSDYRQFRKSFVLTKPPPEDLPRLDLTRYAQPDILGAVQRGMVADLERVVARSLFGVNIHVTDLLPKEWKQVRFPKSKRKRIRKKWRKDRGNWAMVETVAMMVVNGQHWVSPKMYATLQRTLKL